MYFAAREAVRKESWRKGRQEGQKAERERIKKEMAEKGLELTPELASILDAKAE